MVLINWFNLLFILLRLATSYAFINAQWTTSSWNSPFLRYASSGRILDVCPLIDKDYCDSDENESLKTDNGSSEIFPESDIYKRTKPLRTPYMKTTKEPSIEVTESDAVKTVTHPQIATFDEWTKEKLKNEKKRALQQNQKTIGNGVERVIGSSIGQSSTTNDGDTVQTSPQATVPHKATPRNYASKECGAKILFSNEEAQNTNSLLKEKESDDYMRNPCERAKHKWLIIELCETIQPTALEIGNFELFSSGPQSIKLLGSERYPSNEWVLLGDFTAENNRELQRFPISVRSYLKFMRLELLTHYGNEHYCTLSMVRLLGISMVDEYEAEAEAAEAVNSPEAGSATEIPDATKNVTIHPEVLSPSTIGPGETIDAENKSDKEIPLVGAVVNAVESIALMKGVIESALLGKRKVSEKQPSRKSFSLAQFCEECRHIDNFTPKWTLYCRLFSPVMKMPKIANQTLEVVKKEREINANSTEKGSTARLSYGTKMSVSLTNGQKLLLSRLASLNQCDLHYPAAAGAASPTNGEENVMCTANGTNATTNATVPNITTIPFMNDGQMQDTPTILLKGYTLPGGVTSHKESIFLKLNKRISALELNMSLSSEYLSELSRQYVVQTNESRRQTEKILQKAEEIAVQALRPVVENLSKQIEALWVDLKELRESVKALSIQTYKAERRMVHRGDSFVESSSVQRRSSSLARAHYGFHEHGQLYTISQVYCFIAACNIIMALLILLIHCLCLRYVYVNRTEVQLIVDEQIRNVSDEKLVAQNVEKAHSSEVHVSVTRTEAKLAELKDIKLELKPLRETDKGDVRQDDKKCQLFAPAGKKSEFLAESRPVLLTHALTINHAESEQTSSVRSSLSETSDWVIKKRKKRTRKTIKKDEPKKTCTSNVFMHLADA